MSQTRRITLASVTVAAVLAAIPIGAAGQIDHTGSSNRPNPFRTIEGWAKLPAGRTWGSTSAVAIDVDGRSVWVGERCGANQCRDNTTADPILKFDPDGNLVESFGAGMIIFPHGIDVDSEGNVWVTDGQDSRPPGGGGRGGGAAPPPPPPGEVYGHQVLKFSPTGEVLLALGAKGGIPVAQRDTTGGPGTFFWQPNDVLVAPNGDVFVAEGHGNGETSPGRIIKFNSEGEFLMTFGERGSGPGQFLQPHALAMDSRGRLFVGDRANNRVQIFDQDGNFIDMWYQFSRPSGLWIDHNDWLYSADSESRSVNPAHDWPRGIRIGSAVTGEVFYFIPDPDPACGGTCAAEGVAVDRSGIIYGAEVGPRKLQRYVWREGM